VNEPVDSLIVQAPRSVASGWRWLLAAVGLVCFGLAAVGAIVPGLPTTVFLLIGSYFLTRSCPWLERRLVQSRLFRPCAAYLDPSTPVSARGRATALAAMWLSIAISIALLVWRQAAGNLAIAAIAAAGVVGTVAILRFRRHLDKPASRGR
jgi:hypothetical protein